MAATPEVDLRRGLAALRRGEYGEAIGAWQQARRAGAPEGVDRAVAEAHFRRALAATNEGRRIHDLHAAATLAPDCPSYHFHLGLAYHRQGQLRRALAAYEAAAGLAPDDDRLCHHLALALLADPATAPRVHDLLDRAPRQKEPTARLRALAWLRQGEPARAVATLTALKNPSPLAVLALGLAHLAAGQTEAALEALARVRRSRKPLGDAARQAAIIATAAAGARAGDLTAALEALRGLEAPGEGAPRRALAEVARPLARELLLDEQIEAAVLIWEQALAAAPAHEPTRRVLGHLHEVLGVGAARRGDFAEAARHWEAALAEQPDEVRILHNLALVDERLERWEQASARWEELTQHWKRELRGGRRDDAARAELRHRLVVAYRHLASAYDAADDVHAAARALERALNFDPSLDDLRLRAAELYLGSDEYGSAIEHLRRVLTSRPDDTRVLMDLGSAYDLKGDDRRAQGYLEQALALEPENPAVKATLAGVYHGRGHRLIGSRRAEQAVEQFERALELDPGFSEHYECLGDAYLRLGERDAARATFARGLARDPKRRVAIGGVYLGHGYQREAEKLFREALRLEKSPIARLSIGLEYLRIGDLEKADKYFEPILKGSEPRLQHLLGKLFIESRREQHAIRYLERAAALDPRNGRVRLDLAWAYAFGLHDYARAADELDEAERLAGLTDDQATLAEVREARQGLELIQDPSRLVPELASLGAGWPPGGPWS